MEVQESAKLPGQQCQFLQLAVGGGDVLADTLGNIHELTSLPAARRSMSSNLIWSLRPTWPPLPHYSGQSDHCSGSCPSDYELCSWNCGIVKSGDWSRVETCPEWRLVQTKETGPGKGDWSRLRRLVQTKETGPD